MPAPFGPVVRLVPGSNTDKTEHNVKADLKTPEKEYRVQQADRYTWDERECDVREQVHDKTKQQAVISELNTYIQPPILSQNLCRLSGVLWEILQEIAPPNIVSASYAGGAGEDMATTSQSALNPVLNFPSPERERNHEQT